MFIVVNHDIFGFEVTVGDTHAVHIFNPVNKLVKYATCFLLGYSYIEPRLLFLLDDVAKKLTVNHVFSEKQQALLGLYDFVQVDEIAVSG